MMIKYFAVLGDHKVKIKEAEKSDKYLDLARERRKRLKRSQKFYNGDWKIWKLENKSRPSRKLHFF